MTRSSPDTLYQKGRLFEGRKRIGFCESDTLGSLTADLREWTGGRTDIYAVGISSVPGRRSYRARSKANPHLGGDSNG
jgi:hypothetical protein